MGWGCFWSIRPVPFHGTRSRLKAGRVEPTKVTTRCTWVRHDREGDQIIRFPARTVVDRMRQRSPRSDLRVARMARSRNCRGVHRTLSKCCWRSSANRSRALSGVEATCKVLLFFLAFVLQPCYDICWQRNQPAGKPRGRVAVWRLDNRWRNDDAR